MNARGWVLSRLGGAPASLVEAMLAALPPERGAPVPEALAEGALVLYGRVLAGAGGREDALPLLAADALLTHAFEAQAEEDPDGIAPLAARFGAEGRLGGLAGSGADG